MGASLWESPPLFLLPGKSLLFATAVDAINTLAAAQAASKLKVELKKYLSPQILILDELGYLPIDKHGADLQRVYFLHAFQAPQQ